MTLKLELEIEKTENGKFNAQISYRSADGKSHGIVSLLKDTPEMAVEDTLQPLSVIAPNFTQQEIDGHYTIFPV